MANCNTNPKGEFMQEANYTVKNNKTEERNSVKGNLGKANRKGMRRSALKFGKKGLALALALMSLSMSTAFTASASPKEEELLVFSEEGAIISQEDQTATLFSDDVLVGDTVSRSQQIVDYATQYIGRPYRYGGVSLLHGSDCSGFLMGIFGHFGIGLPHSSAEIGTLGTNVGSLANAIPGDVLAYSGHVGIYLGNGRMLSALNSRSGVTIESATYKPIKSIRRFV